MKTILSVIVGSRLHNLLVTGIGDLDGEIKARRRKGDEKDTPEDDDV